MDTSSSIPAGKKEHDRYLLYAAFNTNVSNFVSAKLSADYRNYHVWKRQMLCLMDTHDMRHLVADEASTLLKMYDSLLKGWIFGSVSEDLLPIIVNLGSAHLIWHKLKSSLDTPITPQPAEFMATSSSTPFHDSPTKQDHEQRLLYASNTNVSNFVSAKLSGHRNYHVWKQQMLCLMDTHDMRHLVLKNYDRLLKGWIFGSVSEDLHPIIDHLDSAKLIWEKLKSHFDSTMTSQQDSNLKDEEKKENIETQSIDKAEDSLERKKEHKKLNKAIVNGSWEKYYNEKLDNDVLTEKIDNHDNTALHIAAGVRCHNLIKKYLPKIKEHKLCDIKNSKGSTVLHIAATVGDTEAVKLLIEKDKTLLEDLDNQGKTPLRKACDYMHLDTIEYLLEKHHDLEKVTRKGDKKRNGISSVDDEERGMEHHVHQDNSSPDEDEHDVKLLVHAISTKQYRLAKKLVTHYDAKIAKNDDVLLALARTFPNGLDFWEKLIYPHSWSFICEGVLSKFWFAQFKENLFAMDVLKDLIVLPSTSYFSMLYIISHIVRKFLQLLMLILYYPLPIILLIVFWLMWMLILLVAAIHNISWNTILVPISNGINRKQKEYEEAKEILELVCNIIENSHSHDLYSRPILEAACQDAYGVVDEILERWPEAIECEDKYGYDIIQLATIHRSERIYNLIYVNGDRMNICRTKEDSSKNNMLHLAARLAPSYKLKRITGAALQLQRELQWREEVKKLVLPTYDSKENIFEETPDMIFTKEHENLVKEGEQWIKSVAESCSITAALIITIVFAAAITIPGGSTNGVPEFINNAAFDVFAIADAISLFSSVTSLFVFLSILTTRFAEQDFLVSLPRRLIIGLFSLMVSTTAMMVAFGATFFLVFSQNKLWMLGPICGLGVIPVIIFFILQFPLLADLFRSTYVSKFGKNDYYYRSRFNPADIRLFFGRWN